MGKIKVIIKRPDERYGHVCCISDRLENLQRIVGGYIEVVPVANIFGKQVVLICNEDGKNLNLPHNMRCGMDSVVGTVIMCGVDGEEFADIPINLSQWKLFVNSWENGI